MSPLLRRAVVTARAVCCCVVLCCAGNPRVPGKLSMSAMSVLQTWSTSAWPHGRPRGGARTYRSKVGREKSAALRSGCLPEKMLPYRTLLGRRGMSLRDIQAHKPIGWRNHAVELRARRKNSQRPKPDVNENGALNISRKQAHRRSPPAADSYHASCSFASQVVQQQSATHMRPRERC